MVNLKIIIMPKQINITKDQFNTLENVFTTHLSNTPDDLKALACFQDILEQCLDK